MMGKSNAGKKNSKVGLAFRISAFIIAFALVVWSFVLRFDLGKNNRLFLLTGDYASLAIVLALSFGLGILLQKALIWFFRLEFER